MKARSIAARCAANLAERARLIRIACTRRYYYDDLAAMLPPSSPEITDISGDLDPFSFVRRFPSPSASPPAFAAQLGPASSFSPPQAPPWNSEPTVSAFLGELVWRMRARTVVELGSFVGWTSAHLALALQNSGDGRLYCVEAECSFVEATRANLVRHGLAAQTEVHQGLSTDPQLLARLPAACDLVFIDTSHQYEATVQEIALYSTRLTSQGCLVLHDSIRWGGVRQAVREAADRFHVLTFATEHGNGLTILRPRG